ncbi:MAG: hypothetical protein GY757_23595 [bacterium]|nr:hypothetical protein [bacterium]
MKITTSIRNLYSDLSEQYSKLPEKVEERIRVFKNKQWHYVGRIKEEESFALKIETGGYSKLDEINDFFACTLVVENLHSIEEAEKLIREKFDLHGRRPGGKDFTNNQSDSFKFEDLRLYVKWKDGEGTKPSGLEGLIFEVQIKTFLQHAWSIAVHDLIYKSNEKNWAKERIAFQIKAMLEHAEASILEAESLANSKSLKKKDKLTKKISKVITMLNELWPKAALPNDKKRLAVAINKLVDNVDIEVDALKIMLEKETSMERGTKTLNLSPYGIIIQTLFNRKEDKIVSYLRGSKNNFKIHLHNELDIPGHIEKKDFNNALILNDQ